MNKILRHGLLVVAFLACCPAVNTYAGDPQKVLNIAILPCSDPLATFRKFKPLAGYLNQETGFEVKLIVPKDTVAFEQAIKSGKIDFALQGPHTYMRLSEWYRKDALIKALTWNGEHFVAGSREKLFFIDPEDGKTVRSIPVNYPVRVVHFQNGFYYLMEQPVFGYNKMHERIRVWPEKMLIYKVRLPG